MGWQAPKPAERERHPPRRCEERSDAAIQKQTLDSLDCFALLAMTGFELPPHIRAQSWFLI